MKKWKIIIINSIISIGIFKLLKSYIKTLVLYYDKERDRYLCYYSLLKEWLRNNKNGISIVDSLKRRKIKTIAIYGSGSLGEVLYNEIEESDIEIAYIIDKITDKKFHNIKIIDSNSIIDAEKVDAIIVTPYDYIEIFENLRKVNENMLIISLEQLVYSIQNQENIYE